MASQKREQAPALQGRPRTKSPLATASGLYKGRRNPRTDLKVGQSIGGRAARLPDRVGAGAKRPLQKQAETVARP